MSPHDEIVALLAQYRTAEGGDHNPVYRVLLMAVRDGRWNVGEAQCESVLSDTFSRRMMSNDGEGVVRAMAPIFAGLRAAAEQPRAEWANGAWRAVGCPRSFIAAGPWRVTGWKASL